MDPVKLRKISETAVAARAAKILIEIEAKVQKAAESGVFCKDVWRLKWGTDILHNTRSEEGLIGAAKIVFDLLKKDKMNPELVEGHDGIGMRNWIDIVVRW